MPEEETHWVGPCGDEGGTSLLAHDVLATSKPPVSHCWDLTEASPCRPGASLTPLSAFSLFSRGWGAGLTIPSFPSQLGRAQPSPKSDRGSPTPITQESPRVPGLCQGQGPRPTVRTKDAPSALIAWDRTRGSRAVTGA